MRREPGGTLVALRKLHSAMNAPRATNVPPVSLRRNQRPYLAAPFAFRRADRSDLRTMKEGVCPHQ